MFDLNSPSPAEVNCGAGPPLLLPGCTSTQAEALGFLSVQRSSAFTPLTPRTLWMDSCLLVPLLWAILETTRAFRQVLAGWSLSGVRTSHTCFGMLMCAASVDVKASALTGNRSYRLRQLPVGLQCMSRMIFLPRLEFWVHGFLHFWCKVCCHDTTWKLSLSVGWVCVDDLFDFLSKAPSWIRIKALLFSEAEVILVAWVINRKWKSLDVVTGCRKLRLWKDVALQRCGAGFIWLLQ